MYPVPVILPRGAAHVHYGVDPLHGHIDLFEITQIRCIQFLARSSFAKTGKRAMRNAENGVVPAQTFT
jgi:hypothetical protein